MPLIHFLLIYNIDLGRLVDLREFADADKAVTAYVELEREYAGQGTFEIVLVGADTIETIKRTHGQYFDDVVDAKASPYLAGV